MGNRFEDQRRPNWLSFTQMWCGKPGTGRWHKRLLSKARRRFGRSVCRDGERAYSHMGSLLDVESIVNWKGW